MTCLDKYLQVKLEGRSRPFSLDKARALLLGYLFNALDYNQLKQRLTAMGMTIGREWRSRLIQDQDVLVAFKFPAFQAVCRADKFPDVAAAIAAASDAGVLEADFPLIELLCSHTVLSRHMKTLSEDFKPLSWQVFRQEVSRAVAQNTDNIRGFAYAKMRFLQRWGLTVEDNTLDCHSGAYESLLWQYPRFDGRAHFDNLYRQAARRHGFKKIEYYTAQSRSSFQTDGQYRMETLEVYHETELLGGLAEQSDAGLENNAQVQMHQLLRSGYLADQDKRMLHLMTGNFDSDFDDWLTEQGESQLSLGDNIRKTRRLVLRYLNYPESRIGHLRAMLSGEFRTVAQEPTFDLPTVLR